MAARRTAGRTTRKLELEGDFYSDLETEDMLYGVLIRSPAATGSFTDIPHADLPEGYHLYTASDVPGSNLITTMGISTPVFCEGTVGYKGEPLGILVGPDEKKVMELVSGMEIVFDSNTIEACLKRFEETYSRPFLEKRGQLLPQQAQNQSAQVNAAEIEAIEKAMNLDTVPASGTVPVVPLISKQNQDDDSILYERIVRTGAAASCPTGAEDGMKALFAEAAFTSTHTWSSRTQIPVCDEPNGAICLFRGKTLSVYTPTQWLSQLRSTLETALGIDGDHILVNKTNSTLNGTTRVWYNAILAAQAAVASFHTGKPVKLVLSRTEQRKYMERPLPVTITHQTALSKDGVITAMQISIDVDAGAVNPFASEIVDRLVIAAAGIYNPQNLYIRARAHRTAHPSSSVDLQQIDCKAFYAVENQIQAICTEADLLPTELRKLNAVSEKASDTHTPFNIQLKETGPAIDALARTSDFNRKYASYYLDSLFRRNNAGTKNEAASFALPLRGIGMATAFEGSGYYGSGIYSSDQTMEVTLESDGSCTIHTLPPSYSIQEIWTKIAAAAFDIKPESVHIARSFDISNEPQLPESVTCNISIMTQLLQKCCAAIQKKKAETPLPITVKKEVTAAQRRQWNMNSFSGIPFHSTAFAGSVIELELDPCSYREMLRGIWVVVNAGHIYSAKAAETSIKNGIRQVLSSLIAGESVKCPLISISFVQSDEPPAQVGELVFSTIPAAFTAALSQALHHTVTALPLSTDSIFVETEKAARETAAAEAAITTEVPETSADKEHSGSKATAKVPAQIPEADI